MSLLIAILSEICKCQVNPKTDTDSLTLGTQLAVEKFIGTFIIFQNVKNSNNTVSALW